MNCPGFHIGVSAGENVGFSGNYVFDGFDVDGLFTQSIVVNNFVAGDAVKPAGERKIFKGILFDILPGA